MWVFKYLPNELCKDVLEAVIVHIRTTTDTQALTYIPACLQKLPCTSTMSAPKSPASSPRPAFVEDLNGSEEPFTPGSPRFGVYTMDMKEYKPSVRQRVLTNRDETREIRRLGPCEACRRKKMKVCFCASSRGLSMYTLRHWELSKARLTHDHRL